MRMIIEHLPSFSYNPEITVEYLPIPQWDDRFSSLAATGGKQRKRARQIKRARRMGSAVDDVIDQMIKAAGRKCGEILAEAWVRWAELGEPA